MGRHFAEVEFGGQKVDVPEGGYYDRFRMKPDLDEVARDPAAGNIDSVGSRSRQVASRMGPTWAPNFYYRSSNIQLLFLAPIGGLRAMLPNTLSCAQRLFPRDVNLLRGGGPMSQLLDGLGASTIMRVDVIKDAQLVLNMPTPLKAFDRL